MGAEPDVVRDAGEEGEGSEGLTIGGVGVEGEFTGVAVGVKGCDVGWNDDVVADPDGTEAVFSRRFGP